MVYYSENPYIYESELYHHGILGQKLGVRRYQNSDGTLTEAGAKRYNKALDKVDATRAKKEAYDTEANSKISEKKARLSSEKNSSKASKLQESINKMESDKERTDAKYDEAISKGERKAEKTYYKNEFGKIRDDISKSRDDGYKLLTNVWAGPFANMAYNSALAANNSQAMAIGKTTAAAYLGGPVGNIILADYYATTYANKKMAANS